MIKLGDLMIPGFVAAMLVVGVMAIYKLGESDGAADVQAQWNADKELRDEVINTLRGEYTVLQSQHKKRIEELTGELETNQSEYEATLLRNGADYAKRLQLATSRADVYQRQARGSTVEQDRLAKHAAELDRSLEEGRALVRELWETVRQRDVTIRALGGIILTDHTLLEKSNER